MLDRYVSVRSMDRAPRMRRGRVANGAHAKGPMPSNRAWTCSSDAARPKMRWR